MDNRKNMLIYNYDTMKIIKVTVRKTWYYGRCFGLVAPPYFPFCVCVSFIACSI